jgi:hypothetical protein
MKHHEPATRPYEFLHANLGEVDGRHFLVKVDQFNSWPAAIIECSQTKRNHPTFYQRFPYILHGYRGCPIKIYCENSQFGVAELKYFLRDWGVAVGSSFPDYIKIKRQVESSLKSSKVNGSRPKEPGDNQIWTN